DRGDGHEEAERSGDERLRDPGRDGRDAARPGDRHAGERVDDAERGPEEAHEGRGGADGRELREAALQVRQVDRGGPLDRPLGRVHGRFLVAVGLTDLLLVLPFLQSDDQDLGQVRVLDPGAVGGVDGFLDLPLLQEPRDLGGVLARLLRGLGEGVVPLDHHADGVDGHDREDDDDAPRDPPHVLGHGPQVKLHLASSWTGFLGGWGPPQESLKFTVTVMMTGTGTPLRRVGVYTHCLTASMAAESSRGMPRRTFTSVTLPWGLIVHSRMTTPWTRACFAMSGYDGGTFLSFLGSLIWPPTRTAWGGGGASGRPPTTPP